MVGTSTEIQCLCGEVRVELTGEPVAQFYCHCDDCQAVHSAAYVPVAMYPARAVTVSRGSPVVWQLRTTPRSTCAACGTRIFAEVPNIAVRTVCALLLPRGRFQPSFHMQCQYAVRPVRDELPHFKGLPAPFGGADETMPW